MDVRLSLRKGVAAAHYRGAALRPRGLPGLHTIRQFCLFLYRPPRRGAARSCRRTH